MEDFCFKSSHQAFVVSYQPWIDHNMKKHHFHGSYEMMYIISGERKLFINDRVYRLRAGELVLIYPNVLHRAVNTCAQTPGCERLVIRFNDEIFLQPHVPDSLFQSRNKNDNLVVRLDIVPKSLFEDMIYEMLAEAQRCNTTAEIIVQALIMKMVVQISRSKLQHHKNHLEPENSKHQLMMNIIGYMNQSYSEPLSLSSVADCFYISSGYLSRIFKEITGFTFTEYLSSIRIREAKKLLMDTRLKVTQIADQVGYGSITQFGRVFKQITGHPPLYYRSLRIQMEDTDV